MNSELAAVAGSYLLGSLPFSYLVARLAGVQDLRKVGSGNVGATNVMRSAGKLAGFIAFALDASKGAIAVAIAQRFDASGMLAALAAAGAVLGHVFPVWLGFRGGKGVATGAGAFLPVSPWASAGAVATFAVALLLTRYVSISSISGAVALVALLFALRAPTPVAWAGALLSIVVIARHASNIRRLANGTERRIGGRA